jgi:bifunctional DNA-binding transcriptional regulator/antitoxin component of YhaV-PrlF toxin-antitoxin module
MNDTILEANLLERSEGSLTTLRPQDVGLRRIEPARRREVPWPDPLGPEARIGIAGEVLDAVEPTTEGDPNAILLQLLASLGNLLGGGPHLVIDEKRHPLKVWVLVVGATAGGKKGTGLGRVFSLLDEVDPDWTFRRKAGIASGEAIIHHVRDDQERVRRVRKSDGTVLETAETVEGESDKRLLLKEEEFSRVLRIAAKEGTTISATIREAWDSDILMTTSKTAPEKATGAHVTIIGHITPEELRRDFSASDLSNGFANRFLFACSRRSKHLARPPRLEAEARERLAGRCRAVRDFARGLAGPTAEVYLSEESWSLWEGMKRSIEEEVERAEAAGLLITKVITRGPPYVLRLAALYAVLERTRRVEPRHLEAARAVWRYSVDSARVVFADDIVDPDAKAVLAALAESEDLRLRRSQIGELFSRNRSAREIDRLRDALIAAGRIEAFEEIGAGQGRPAEWWVLQEAAAPRGA